MYWVLNHMSLSGLKTAFAFEMPSSEKARDQFIVIEHFLIGAGRPPEQSQKIAHRFRQDALFLYAMTDVAP